MVLVANAFVGNKTPHKFAKWVDATGCDVALLCELGPRTYKWLRVVGRLVGVLNPAQATRGQRECGVWFPDAGWRDDSTALHKLTSFTGKPIGTARHAREAIAQDVAWLSTHGNAAIHRRRTGRWIPSKRTDEWRDRGLPRLAQIVAEHRAAGRPVALGLDANVTDRGEASLRHWCKAHGLRYTHNDNLLWLVWSDEYRMTKRVVKDVPPGARDRNGHGHEALLVTLEKEIA